MCRGPQLATRHFQTLLLKDMNLPLLEPVLRWSLFPELFINNFDRYVGASADLFDGAMHSAAGVYACFIAIALNVFDL